MEQAWGVMGRNGTGVRWDGMGKGRRRQEMGSRGKVREAMDGKGREITAGSGTAWEGMVGKWKRLGWNKQGRGGTECIGEGVQRWH